MAKGESQKSDAARTMRQGDTKQERSEASDVMRGEQDDMNKKSDEREDDTNRM